MRRFLLLACALVSVVGLAVGAGGFTSAESDRGVSVEVVGDEDAYLALEYANGTVDTTVDETVALAVVTATNQFTEDVDVTVDYRVDAPAGVSASISDGSNTADLGVGEMTEVSTTVTCDQAGQHEVTIEFDASATGDGVSADTSRPRTVDYTVDCDTPATP